MLTVAKGKPKSGFGTRLRALREAAVLTQAQLAEKAEMLPNALARLERGEREPGWPTVLKLAEALGVTPDAFTSDDDTDDTPEPKKKGKK
jgi:transcriptional regulator with XRE-family HTH domain